MYDPNRPFQLQRPGLLGNDDQDGDESQAYNEGGGGGLPDIYSRGAQQSNAGLAQSNAGLAQANAQLAQPSASGGAAAAGAAKGGAMPWVGAVADALAKRQQEVDQRRQAQAGLAGQYAASQGSFPMYGLEGAQKNRAINDANGGPGLGTLRRFGRGLRGGGGFRPFGGY